MKKSGILAICTLLLLTGAASAGESGNSPAAGVEIGDWVARYAKRNHREIVLDSRVSGQVVVYGVEPEAVSYDQFLAILSVNMLAAVRSGDILAIMPDANARQFPGPIYTDLDFKAADHEIVNLLVTPRRVCAAQLVPVLRPLQPQAAHLAADPQSNTLIINDHAINARKIARLVEAFDQRGKGDGECKPGIFVSPAKDKDRI